MPIAGPGRFNRPDERPVVVLIDPPYQEYERRGKVLNQMIVQLVEKMPGGSVVVVEAGRVLDERVLEDLQSWDIRRYSSTRIAIRVVGGRGDRCRFRPRCRAPAYRRPIETGARVGVLISMSDAGSGRDSRAGGRAAITACRSTRALWAGGCVRDLILGQSPADYDVATDATPEQVMAVLPSPRRSPSGSRSVSCGSGIRRRSGSRGRGRGLSGATVLMSTDDGPNRWYSARRSSTRPAAISRSMACFSIH